MKKLFVTTEDYNAYIITDGIKGWSVPDFDDYGTLEDAKTHDIEGIEGSETWEDIEIAMGAELDLYDYSESDYETVDEIGTL